MTCDKPVGSFYAIGPTGQAYLHGHPQEASAAKGSNGSVAKVNSVFSKPKQTQSPTTIKFIHCTPQSLGFLQTSTSRTQSQPIGEETGQRKRAAPRSIKFRPLVEESSPGDQDQRSVAKDRSDCASHHPISFYHPAQSSSSEIHEEPTVVVDLTDSPPQSPTTPHPPTQSLSLETAYALLIEGVDPTDSSPQPPSTPHPPMQPHFPETQGQPFAMGNSSNRAESYSIPFYPPTQPRLSELQERQLDESHLSNSVMHAPTNTQKEDEAAEEMAKKVLEKGELYLKNNQFQQTIQLLWQTLLNADMLLQHRARDDTNAKLYMCLGTALIGDGEFDNAIVVLQMGFAFSNASTLTMARLKAALGYVYYKKKDLNQAVLTLQAALLCDELEDEDKVSWSTFLGRAFFEMQCMDSAIVAFRKALAFQNATQNTKASLLVHLGIVLMEVRKTNDAKDAFQTVIEMTDIEDELKARAYGLLAQILANESYELFQKGARLSRASAATRMELITNAQQLAAIESVTPPRTILGDPSKTSKRPRYK